MTEKATKMRAGWALGAAGVLLAGPALAEPSIEIKDAAARVILVPEARNDIKVQLISASSALPVTVRSKGDRTIVDGRLRHRINGCSAMFGRTVVHVRGLGQVAYDDLPQIIIHAPLDVRIGASGAVFGSVGRARSVELSNQGCGDWTIANVEAALKINEAGSGGVRAGRAGQAVVHVAGSGDISARDISGPAVVDVAGSGNVTLASISGDLRASVAGSGDVRIAGGSAPNVVAHLAGSGDVDFQGVAGDVSASIAGSGNVNVAKATGAVKKSVFGSGDVKIGR
jgi:hypothetical protein